MTSNKHLIISIAMVSVLAGCSSASVGDPGESTTPTIAVTSSATPADHAATTADVPGDEPSVTTASSTPPAERPSTSTTARAESAEPMTTEVPPERMSQVLAAAELELGVKASEMVVLRAESVVWPDGSLGCPEPGQAYAQVEVEGFWVELSAGGLELDYRLDATGRLRSCGKFVAPPTTVWPGDPDE